MVKLVNRARMTTATTGTGTITLGAASSGYQSFADAGVADADVVRYVIEDGSAWEIGAGTYTASGTTLTRTVLESSNSDAALNLSGSATVYVTATASDIQKVLAEGAFVDGDKTKLDGIEAGADVTDAANVGAALGTSGAGAGEVLSWTGSAFDWIAVGGSGTVTSVAATVPTGFAVSGSPVTSSGTLAITYDTGYQGYTTTESSKLAGIEAGADVTDATNVAAAGAAMTSGATFTGQLTVKETAETNYNLTGSDVDPANGTVQYKTTTGAETITGTNFANGQSVTLRLTAATSVAFTGFNWITSDGAAPTIASNNDVFVLWMDNSTKFVAYVGNDG